MTRLSAFARDVRRARESKLDTRVIYLIVRAVLSLFVLLWGFWMIADPTMGAREVAAGFVGMILTYWFMPSGTAKTEQVGKREGD